MKKLVAMMLMLASVFFFACEDDDPDPLSPEKAKAELNELSAQMSTDLADMQETEGMIAMKSLMNMTDPFSDSKSGLRTAVIPNIYESIIPFSKEINSKLTYEVDSFDFDTYKGTYTWNNNAQLWEITLGGNTIIINFPSNEANMGVNDAKLTISNYQEDANYNPTAIAAKLEINEIVYVEITFSATWTEDEPTILQVSIYLKPFTFSGGFEQTSSTASVNFSIVYENTRLLNTSLSITFTDTTKEEIKKIVGYIQYRDIKISAAINLANIMEIRQSLADESSPYTTMDELISALNKEIDAKITKNGALVATIKLAMTDQGITVVLKFSDGSTEPAQPFFEVFISNLEDLFGFIKDYFSDEGTV